MKYIRFTRHKKEETTGGAYWKESDIHEHLKLTPFQTTYNFLLKNFSPPKNILEAGCGLGRWVIPLSEKGYRVTGIEIEQDAVSVINQHFKSENLQVVQGDIFNMPFENNQFDLVISLGVLEHFKEEEMQLKAILEHKRVLKDDGVFLVTVPYFSLYRLFFNVPYGFLLSLVRKMKGKPQYFSEYRYHIYTFKRLLNKAGFTINHIIYDELMPPFNFGLLVDPPLNKHFKSNDGVEFKMNFLAEKIFKFLWKIHPSIVSGGIGFACKKTK